MHAAAYIRRENTGEIHLRIHTTSGDPIADHRLKDGDDKALIDQAHSILDPLCKVGPFTGPVANTPHTLDLRAALIF